MKIEIGSGLSPKEGYVSCDVRNISGVDYVCEAHKLPFKDDSIEEIYSRHLVEHFSLKEFLEVLQEWNRVLKKGGVIYIICPNLIWHLKQIIKGSHQSFFNKNSGENDRYWGLGSLFGWQQNNFDFHKFGYYFELLRDILLEFGFVDIENLTNKHSSVEGEPWHLEIKGIKLSNVGSYEKSVFYSHFDVQH
jgi:predicted SAM-dependent methyltransferase